MDANEVDRLVSNYADALEILRDETSVFAGARAEEGLNEPTAWIHLDRVRGQIAPHTEERVIAHLRKLENELSATWVNYAVLAFTTGSAQGEEREQVNALGDYCTLLHQDTLRFLHQELLRENFAPTKAVKV